mgnify:CR=1 FL=1
MKAPFDFVIEPKGNRYNNIKKIDGKDLILNTEVYNHQFVNREAIVKSIPTAYKTKSKGAFISTLNYILQILPYSC